MSKTMTNSQFAANLQAKIAVTGGGRDVAYGLIGEVTGMIEYRPLGRWTDLTAEEAAALRVFVAPGTGTRKKYKEVDLASSLGLIDWSEGTIKHGYKLAEVQGGAFPGFTWRIENSKMILTPRKTKEELVAEAEAEAKANPPVQTAADPVTGERMPVAHTPTPQEVGAVPEEFVQIDENQAAEQAALRVAEGADLPKDMNFDQIADATPPVAVAEPVVEALPVAPVTTYKRVIVKGKKKYIELGENDTHDGPRFVRVGEGSSTRYEEIA